MSDRLICGLPVHEAAALFPLITGADFDALVEDIRTNGQMEPLVLDADGAIIDGRNRGRACERLGIRPTTKRYDGDNVLQYVISHNLHRRHLTDSQRAMIAAQLATRTVADNGQHMKAKAEPADISRFSMTRNDASQMLQVSQHAITQAKIVHREGTPELAALVAEGHAPVTTAARVAQELTPDEQNEFVAEVRAGANPVKIAPPDLVQQRRDARTREARPQRSEFQTGTRHIDAARVITETIGMLEGIASGLALIEGQLADLDNEKRLTWLDAIREPLKAITRFTKELAK